MSIFIKRAMYISVVFSGIVDVMLILWIDNMIPISVGRVTNYLGKPYFIFITITCGGPCNADSRFIEAVGLLVNSISYAIFFVAGAWLYRKFFL